VSISSVTTAAAEERPGAPLMDCGSAI
jgi:hypothetical protein